MKVGISLFEGYYHSFKNLDPAKKRNFEIKKDHSNRVAELMLSIAKREKMDEDVFPLIHATGLFHDIGRFSQLVDYDTFNDELSVDHAALSVDVLKSKEMLSEFDPVQQEMIMSAILYHNKKEVPKHLEGTARMLASLLRDADKLDILEVLSEYYERKSGEPNHTLTWNLPDAHRISEEVAKVILIKKTIPREIIHNRHDVKVFQMSWVFDLNYKTSFQILSQRRFMERIYQSLPKSEKIIEFYRGIKIFVENRIS